MVTQIKIGNDLESTFLHLLSRKYGYWAYLCPRTLAGQPCDVIALRRDKKFLLDVKHCKNDKFLFSRIETNQADAFKYATELGIPCGFAVFFEASNEWRFWSWKFVQKLMKIETKFIKVYTESDLEVF